MVDVSSIALDHLYYVMQARQGGEVLLVQKRLPAVWPKVDPGGAEQAPVLACGGAVACFGAAVICGIFRPEV